MLPEHRVRIRLLLPPKSECPVPTDCEDWMRNIAKKAATTRRPGRPSGKSQTIDRRAQIVEAALDAFAAHGFEGASLREIARNCDVDLGLIRHYFGSKEDLWYGVLQDLAAQLQLSSQQAFGEDFESITAAEQLERAIRWFVDMSANFPGLSRIIVSESAQPGDRQKFVSGQVVRPFYEVMSTIIDAAKREGVVPEVSTRTIFFMITHGGSFSNGDSGSHQRYARSGHPVEASTQGTR